MTIFILIFLILLVGYSILIDYYRRSWNSIPEAINDGPASVKITVVIAVRNEETNLPHLLECLAQQDYPKELWQAIIIDDHSTDNTWKVLHELSPSSFSLITLQLPPQVSSKKKAIEYGVLAATGDLIITSDADCTMPPGWISSFASFYEHTGAKFIAAPVAMRANNSFAGIFQSLDFITLQTITGASVYKRFHTMCNGANLAFEKGTFLEVNGYEGIDNIPSGDDMLLMQKIFSLYPDKVMYMKSREALVTTPSQPTWKSFLNQRIRWSSKAVHYKDKNIFNVLLLTYILNVCFLFLGIASIVSAQWFSMFVLFLAAKILIEFPLVNAGAIFFQQQRLMKWFPLMQPVHILYVIVAGWLGRFGSYEWKSRVVKNTGKRNLAKQ